MSHAATKTTAMWVVRRLRKAGHQALFAGGCVRDMLLGERCTDYDVATDATPDQVRRLFPHVLLVGAKFGVAMVIVDRRKVEVTTFRSDVSYSDGRRPDGVRFTTAREDAQRRDFTINGMFYDPIARQVIDYMGGQADLQARVIRTIGPAEDRFGEDYLRMIRAVRFAVRFGFAIDPATAAAVRHHAPRITGISGERIFDELSKMLGRESAAEALAKLAELGLAKYILGDLLADEGVWRRAVERVAAVAGRRDVLLTLAALLGELPPKSVVASVRRWGASNDIRDAVCWIAEHLGGWRGAMELSLADFKRLMANGNFERLRILWGVQERMEAGQRADASPTAISRQIARRAAGIPKDKVAPAPLVTGADLKELGLSEGPRLGRLLKALYDAQLNEEISTHHEAMELARKLLGAH